MAGKRATRGNDRGKGKASASVPDVYQEMLCEVLPAQSGLPDRPLKRRRTGRIGPAGSPTKINNHPISDNEEDLEFEDVLAGSPSLNPDNDPVPPKLLQTATRDSDDDSDESDYEWEHLDVQAERQNSEPTGDLELNLTRNAAEPTRQRTTPRRKAINKAEKSLRLETHKLHVLCLLSYLKRRNDWCNDEEVHASLKPLLDKKMLQFLRPKVNLSQFGQAESLKRGIEQVSAMWNKRFTITTRGLRRALWADDEKDIHNYSLPGDADLAFEKSDFRSAAKTLQGSRDMGAQLYCALLRSADVDVRLVCSLQPLSFNVGGPGMPRASAPTRRPSTPKASDEGEAVEIGSSTSLFASSGNHNLPIAPRRRLGHPNAADYHMPIVTAPVPVPIKKPKVIAIHESPYPVFWVEVFDEAHQKWFPVDPLVTRSVARPRLFEPPASDRENNMSYVIAFEDVGCARDVTRRYTKAYNAKVRKNRVESTPGGVKWWRKAMRTYKREWISDADQIEDTELAATEAREPMPKNIADFKDHPYYALERHLRRNEVLTSTREVGKVAAGRDSNAPGGKRMESIYRRRDVRLVRSADAWYRLGRDIKMGEQPLKTVVPKGKLEDDDGEDMDERAGTNLYSEDQTEIYVPPPVVNGRVPRNSFGNLDVFVPSMVPKGGVHLPYAEASRAARILGIDYADALTGFEFRGRHGTAVLKGIVVANEFQEAVEEVIRGFQDDEVAAQEEMRTVEALKMWRHLLMSLRIKKRVDGYNIEGEEEAEETDIPEPEMDIYEDQGLQSEEYEYSDDGGGGFFPE